MVPPRGDEAASNRKRNTSGTTSTVPSKKSNTSPAKKTPIIINYGLLEEKQAKERSPSQDSKNFEDTCNKMKDILSKVHEVKQSGRKSSDVLSELKTDFLMQFMTLKKLNRLDKLRTKHSRDSTIEAKAMVDSLGLQLQNLHYEVLHLQKEVNKCTNYKSLDQSIDLVPENEFYENAPEEISCQEKTQTDEHLKRLARLEYEKLQREEQSQELKKIEGERDSLESHIDKKRENLSNLNPQLATILSATEPVQAFLNMPFNHEKDQLELAKYLPAPLFTLFSETRAYSQACDSNATVKIEGDLDEAKAEFSSNLRKRMATTGDAFEDDDEEAKEEEDEEDSKKKKKKQTNSKSTTLEEKTKKVLSSHPLKVVLQVKLKNLENMVLLTFSHLTELQVVSVKVKLQLDQECRGFGGHREVMQAQNLLSHLLIANDNGIDCPNPAYNYNLKKAGIDPQKPSQLGHVGSMYFWAQNLAGLQFPSKLMDLWIMDDENFVVNSDASICQPIVEKTIEAIRERLLSRIHLQREISLLEKSKLISVDPEVPENLKSHFPPKISSTIRAWASVNWEQYVALDVTKHLVDSGAVDENDFLFRLQINRDTAASLIALIAVKPDHPSSPPVFCLNLHWNGEHNMHNSEYIRYLERTINYGFVYLLESKNRDKYQMLGLQIKKLMACCDVLLESWQLQGDNEKQDFAREKIFIHTVRGKRRLPPLSYDSSSQIFSQ